MILLPTQDPILFLEVEVSDASEFADAVKVEAGIACCAPRALPYRMLLLPSPSSPRSDEKNPARIFPLGVEESHSYLFDYVAFGTGDTAPVTRELLRQAEPDEEKRPAIHIGGY